MPMLISPPDDEVRVNTTTLDHQYYPSIATLPGGSWVVTWQSNGQDGSSWGVYLQRYDAAGARVGGEIQVNTRTLGTQQTPKVTALADGGYLVSWTSGGQDGYGSGVYTQRYSASGAAVGGETRVNTTVVGDQFEQSVTSLVGGGYVVSWTSADQDGPGSGVYAQLYDAAGAKVGGETLVNSYTISAQYESSSIGLAGGGYVISWTSLGQDGSSVGVYAQRFDANGAKAGPETRVNTTTAGDQWRSSLAALSDGGYVVSWSSSGQDGRASGVFSGHGVYLQRYSASGLPVGGETLVNTRVQNDQTYPSVTGLTDGGYVVTWMSYGQDGFGWGVYAQRYDAGGARVGDETQVNTSTADFEQSPSVAALPRGGFVVSWMAFGQDGSGSGVYQRAFPGLDPASPPVASDAVASGSEDGGPITGAVSATDANDDSLTYALIGAAPAGVVFNADGTFSVTPLAADQALRAGETRIVTFQYLANDGSANSEPATVTVTITGVNDAPLAAAAAASGTEDGGTITGAVSATDVDGEPLTYALVGEAPAGVVFNADGTFSVTPLAADQALDIGETRVVTFRYVANDGSATSEPATVTVTIAGVNDAPVAADVAASGTEDGGAVTGAVSATDVDGEPLTYTLVDETPAGVVFNADGTFSVTPLAADQALDDGETRVVTFQYRASDGSTGSAPATVTVTITGVNDAPVVSRPIANLAPLEDVAFSFTLAPDVFIDPDGDVLSFIATLANGDALPSWLQFNAATRTFSGTPQEGDRPVTVRVVAHDGSVSVAHEFTITPQDNPGEIWTGGSGHDHHVGTDRQDVLQGGKGHDTLNGGAGADWIWGGVGHDTLTGGAGRDTFVFERRSGHDVITDFLVGTDRLLFTGGVSIERLIEIDTNDDHVADSTMVVLGSGDHVILMDVLGVTQSQLLTPDWMI